MKKNQEVTSSSLNLEVKEVERKRRPGCNSSSTSPLCTCPIIFTPEVRK